MTAKTSFPSRFREFRQIYVWSLKKSVGLTGLLTALLLFVIPLPLLFCLSSWKEGAQEMVQEALKSHSAAIDPVQYINEQYSSTIQTLIPLLTVPILLIFCVVLTVVLFGYMHKKRSVDLFHALPVGRVSMLLGRWAAGLTVLFVPTLLSVSAVQIIAAANGLSSGVSSSNSSIGRITLGAMLGWILLMTAAVFTFSMLIAVCSGSIFDTAVSVLGICAGYPLLIWAAGNLTVQVLPGFAFDLRTEVESVTLFSPYAAAFVPFITGKTGAGYLVLWLVMTLVMLTGACWIYFRRKSEAAEDNFAFPALKIVIRFLVTALTAVSAGLIMGHWGMWGFVIGVLLGSLTAHVVMEAVYSRGFRNLKRSMVWYACFALCFVGFYGILATGCFGYDTRLPEASEVESVSLTNPNDGSGTNLILSVDHGKQLKKLSPELNKEESIEAALEANRKLESFFRSGGFPYSMKTESAPRIEFTYRLKNGRTFHRGYFYAEKGFDRAAYQKIRGSAFQIPEFVEKKDLLFYLNPDDIKDIDISSNDDKRGGNYTLNAEQKQKLVEALKADMLAGKVNQDEVYDASNTNWLSVNIEFRDNIVPSGRLKELLGGYQGRLYLPGGGYDIRDQSTLTWQFVQGQGWSK